MGHAQRMLGREHCLLPKGLEPIHIRKAVDFVEERTSDLVDLYYEQANIFSGIVGIFGAKALDALSPYKRHKHPDIMQQRFPDLSLRGQLNPPPELALESKGSTRPWAIQSHYDHPGWYVVWRYLVDPVQSIKPGREIIIWRVDMIFIRKEDWKYEGSKAGMSGGGRTHTFGLRTARSKLKGCAAYSLASIKIVGNRPVLTGKTDADT
jgi:hypothetical protein